MNRRRAIWGIGLLTGSGLTVGSAWFTWYKTPDLAYITRHKALVAALAETIIPTTDTPGAIAAGVPDFILKSVFENATTLAQNRFVAGLKAVDAYSLDTYNKLYIDCSPKQQEFILSHIEASDTPRGGLLGKVQKKLTGEPFFSLLKSYTCLGYCTSRLGATQGMAYVPIPGRFASCVPMPAGQKGWATK